MPKHTMPNTIYDSWRHNPRYKEKDRTGNLAVVKRFCALPHSLVMNNTFISLSPTAKVLYMYMTDYANGNKETKFPKSLYTKFTTCSTFDKNIKELEEKGFIKTIISGKSTRSPNVYRFISDWWEKPPIIKTHKKIPPSSFKRNYNNA